ncbi:hypothetical protein [Alkalihalobacillus sp. 1P02AB]|uniref:hypothetical protein n=1 Tax=Alkalihalobacillus sp. 1P02AB TaxID=3132260 RepID=UPI0039A4D7B7
MELSYNGPIRIYFDGNAYEYAYTEDEHFRIINQGYQFKQETELEAGEGGTYQMIFDPHFKVNGKDYYINDIEVEPIEVTIK